jgi:exo-beta-1,3-glucanase (GH17 family)
MTNVVGVNYSNTYQSAPISDADAATQIKALGATSVKLFNYTQTSFLDQARAQGLSVLIAVPNDGLQALSNNDTAALVSTIRNYTDVITGVCIGNEPLGSWQPPQYATYLPTAVSNVYAALSSNGLQLEITVPFNYSIMGASWPPSQGAFGAQSSTIAQVCAVLQQAGSRFMINMYPYLDHINNTTDIPLAYCLFQNTSPQFTDPNWQLPYYNIFDAAYDALVQALTGIGYGALPVAIGECGWPTAGGLDASVSNAQTFVNNLVAHCNGGGGTPKHPGIQIPCYLFEMYDEDQKSTAPGAFEPYWGLYSDQGGTGVAKYPLSLG